MSTTAAYTPLESLLLFQSLAAYGTDPNVFTRTSDLLKNNPLVKECDNFDAGRLSSDSLQELYLQLLHEEIRNEASQNDTNGDASPSKKRKIQSPALPTIKDAHEHTEKLPQLVDRLYARYRDHMILAIREDERQYEKLQREIAAIERGEWDEKLLEEERSKNGTDASVPTHESGISQPSGESQTPANATDFAPSQDTHPTKEADAQKQEPKSSSPLVSATELEAQPDGLAISDVVKNQDGTPQPPHAAEKEGLPNNQNVAQPPTSSTHQRTPSHDRPHGPSSLQPAQQRPTENWKWEQYPAPQQPMQYPNQNYSQYPPQYPQYPAPPRGSFPGPHGLPPPQGHVPSSPINAVPHAGSVPPLNGARASGSPSQQLEALADIAEQQYRAPSASPMVQQGSMEQGVPMQQGAPLQQGPPYGQYPPYPPQFRNDGRQQPGNGPPQWNQQYVPPYPPPPNYNYSPQTQPGQRPFVPRPDLLQQEQRQYNSPYNPSNGPRSTLPEQFRPGSTTSTPKSRPSKDAGVLPHTPASGARPRYSTGKATQWTPIPTASTPKAPRSPVQPAFEPLSPVIPAIKLTASSKSKKAETPATGKGRSKNQRGQRTVADSTSSPAVPGSRRSHSVVSHADELSLENERSGRKVKQEPATPKPAEETGDTTADEGTSNRLQGKIQSSPRRTQKRKRQESPEPEPVGPPTTVLWTRNFPKISASALERIGAHRNASTFALPIKERDAPGYKNVILRPQDLKSIRSAVVAGNKAGAAIASMEDQVVTLPRSEDLIPPKAIVNNSQLEKELMLMFANAIMFNLDPDRGFGPAFPINKSTEEVEAEQNYEVDENGVVKDTRAMFADVEKIVGEMRSAERRSEDGLPEVEEDEVDELAGDGDHGGSIAKRRRRA